MRTLSAVSFFLLSTVASLASAQQFDAEGEVAMLGRINAVRAEASLAPLQRSAQLDAVAREHSLDMSARGVIEHVSPVSGTPADRVQRASISASTIAENVALHQSTASAFDALMNSPGHRANILSAEITHVGISSVRAEQGVYVTQLFATIRVEQPVAEVPAIAEEPAQEEEAEPLFQIIPPFVQELIGAAQAALPEGALPENTIPMPVLPEAQDQGPMAGPQMPTQLPPETEAAVRQLVGIANQLLGGSGFVYYE
jgi:hypothetical protein